MREIVEETATGERAYGAWLATIMESAKVKEEEQPAEKHTIESAITKISVDMFVQLRILLKRGQTEKLKSKLREYITMMEELYERM